jgi:hypothetical protein
MLTLPSLLFLAVLGPPEPGPAQPERVEVVAIDSAPEQPEQKSEPAPRPLPPEPEQKQKQKPQPNLDGRLPTPEPEVHRSWQGEIFLDVFYAINSNAPNNHLLRGMVTAPRSGEFVPGVVGGFLRHRATDEEPWWVEVGLHAGASVDSLISADPVANADNGPFAGVEVVKHIALANAGFRIRKSKTSIGAGVFESPFGMSSFWSFRNTTYTPMMQNNIVPYYLVGGRISQEIPGGLTLSAWVVNGSQSYSDLNKAPSGAASLSWSPTPRKGMHGLTLNSHVLFGPETQSIAPEDWYVLWDTTLVWAFDEHFSMGATWDYAIERPGRAKAEQNMYTGGGILARGTVFEHEVARIDLVLRPDVLWDRDGRFFGVPQWLLCPSAGADVALWQRLILRMQYRYDYSTSPTGFFYRHSATSDGGPGLAKSQHTVFFAVTGVWDFWFGRRSN